MSLGRGTRDGKAAGPAEGRAAVRAAGCSDGWPRRGPPGPQHGSAPRLEAGSAGCHPVGECRQGCSPPGWRRSDRCPRGGSLGAAAARAGRTRLSARAGSAVPRARSPALGLPGSRGRACRRALEITFSFFFPNTRVRVVMWRVANWPKMEGWVTLALQASFPCEVGIRCYRDLTELNDAFVPRRIHFLFLFNRTGDTCSLLYFRRARV